MTGYIKKIAVIKQVKGGFSADGGALSGLVKAETYAGFLKVEASLINFAPLTEGRYVLGISDGLQTVLFEGSNYEGECDFNLSCGFAFMVCFCNGTCAPVASAACGQMACALPDLKEEMTRSESAKQKPQQRAKTQSAASAKTKEPIDVKVSKRAAAYDDEAIAEENYYEYNAFEDGGTVREDKAQKKDGRAGGKNEEAVGAVKMQKESSDGQYSRDNGKDKAENPRLARGNYYGRMRGDIEKIFAAYPKESGLENAMEGSRWAKISYGENKYYVFGVLSVEGVPRYICYGVPSSNPEKPPESLQNCASYMPTADGGYWIMYQDADTGVSIKMTPV